MPRQDKKDKVKQIKKWFEKEDSVLVLHYKGLRVAEANELREIVAGHDAQMRVLKNTLTRIALTGTDQEELIGVIDGPVAVIFPGDATPAVAKSVRDFARGRKDLYFQGGLLQGRLMTGAQVDAIATLPPRETLLAQVVGQAAAPLSGFVGVCAGPVRKLLGLFQALADRRRAEAPPEEPAREEQVKEEPEAEPVQPDEEAKAAAETEPAEKPVTEEAAGEEDAVEPSGEEQETVAEEGQGKVEAPAETEDDQE